MDNVTSILVFVAALGCGLAAGVFFAFSTYVMPALGRLPPAEGIAAMRAINRMAPRPFMVAQAGAGVLVLAAAIAALVEGGGGDGAFAIVAAPVYLASVIGLTAGYHVPRNERLDRVEAGRDADAFWRSYLVEWTRWNHLRTLGPLLACALEIAALASS